MVSAPVAMIADAERLDKSGVPFHRYGEGQWALGGGDDAAVAVGLLLETLVLLYDYGVVAIEFLIPLDRTEIGG